MSGEVKFCLLRKKIKTGPNTEYYNRGARRPPRMDFNRFLGNKKKNVLI